MDGGAWWAAVRGVAQSRTGLSNFTFTFHFHALEREMATHSSVLAWRIPGTGEPGRLPSMGLHRVGHDWSDLAAAAADREISRRSLLVKAQGARKSASSNNFCSRTPQAPYTLRKRNFPLCPGDLWFQLERLWISHLKTIAIKRK